MSKQINSFWNLSVEQFKRELTTQKDFYDMLLSVDKGVSNFVYKPTILDPSCIDEYRIFNVKFSNCSFAFTEIKNVSFFNCHFENCKFNHCLFENCNFHDCTFRYVNMFRVKVANTYVDPNSFSDIIPNYRDFLGAVQNANMCVSFFQTLLNNAIDTGQPEFEKHADYHFKKWKGINYLQKKFVTSTYYEQIDWFLFLRNFIPNFVQYWITGFGYRVTNFVLTFAVGFSFFFYMNHSNWNSYSVKTRDVLINSFQTDTANIKSSIYYTLDATTKLIDSQMQPTTDLGMAWLSIQGVFGFLLLSGLITIILNKFVK